jgi:DhnA family fructose-bisphosphate aldolase class Ia
MSSTGKLTRMSRLVPDGRTVMVPFDDALINGPHGGLADSAARAREAFAGGANAVLGFRALHDRCVTAGPVIPFVLNLTASTVRSAHTRKVAVGSVEAALRAGCDGVAAHVNITDRYEHQMLTTLGVFGESCQQWGMPLMAIMYPRRAGADGVDDNYLNLRTADRAAYATLVRHCVRIAVELGADIVKTQYTGDPTSFATVIDASLGVPVVIAGGPRTSVREALDNAHGAMLAGASGVCFGRQTYNRRDVTDFVRKLCLVVRDGVRPGSLAAA